MYKVPAKPFSLVGIDGNAFSIMGYVRKAMRIANMSKKEIDEYFTEAKKGDYDHLLCTSMEMIDKCNKVLELD